MTKLCRDCKHFHDINEPPNAFGAVFLDGLRCGHPEGNLVGGPHPATGYSSVSCELVRYRGACGFEGRLWEPRT